MNRPFLFLSFAFLMASSVNLDAQSAARSANFISGDERVQVGQASPAIPVAIRPFSRLSLSSENSPLGFGAGVATNLNPHLNLRASGNFFDYGIAFNTNGFGAKAQLKLASARTSLDVYPFHSGFRISPGALFYNQNRVTATNTVAAGTSFTLNGDTFYSANANAATGATPVNGTALLNLHSTRPAFTITGGWGNPLAHDRHWSFPFEVGAAFVGAPAVNVNLTGWACYDKGQTQCMSISNPNNPIAVQVQNDLHAQVGKWTRDLDPLKTYPIVSGGVAYTFNTGRR